MSTLRDELSSPSMKDPDSTMHAPSSRRVDITSSRRLFSSAAHAWTRGSDPGLRRTLTQTVSTGLREYGRWSSRSKPCRTSRKAATPRSSRRSAARSPSTRAARRPRRRRSQPLGVHARRRRPRARRRTARRDCVRAQADRPARHLGVHPRIGAADVVPSSRSGRRTRSARAAAARELAQRIGEELGLPVFLYADFGEGRGPAFFRRGGPEELQRRIDAGEVAPDFGPTRLDPRRAA